MAPPSPTVLRWRRRIEFVIRLAEPALNLVLAGGDRLSRIVDRSSDEPVAAIRFPNEVRPLGPGRPEREA